MFSEMISLPFEALEKKIAAGETTEDDAEEYDREIRWMCLRQCPGFARGV